jgi:hypothetical protein
VCAAVLVNDFGAILVDGEALQRAFDACVGTGDDSQSPVLRLVRKLAPGLLSPNHTEEKSAQKPVWFKLDLHLGRTQYDGK